MFWPTEGKPFIDRTRCLVGCLDGDDSSHTAAQILLLERGLASHANTQIEQSRRDVWRMGSQHRREGKLSIQNTLSIHTRERARAAQRHAAGNASFALDFYVLWYLVLFSR